MSPPAAAWVGEGDGSVAVSLSATANARGAGFSLDWSTAAGTAEEGSDYAAASGTLTFAAEDFAPPDYRASGDIAVAILDDAVGEAEEESFGVSFAAAAGSDGVRLSIASTTVWIRDDDAVALTLAAAPAALDESGGARAVTVTATLAGAAASELSVPLSFGGTAEETADYAVSGTRGVTIAAGATSGETELTVTPVDDAVEDDGETIEIGATLTGYAVTAATVRIEEPPPPTIVLSVADATLAESAGAVAVTMELANPRADSVYRQCGLRALSGAAVTATPGADFELAASEERLRSRGGWRAETTLTVVDDAVFEADETLVLEGWCAGSNALARPPHGELRATPLALTIEDDDAVALTLSAAPSALDESGGARAVTVMATLAGAAASELSVPLSFGGTADETVDYAVSGARGVTIAADKASGETELTVTPVDDAADDDGETIEIGATLPGYEVAPATVMIEESPPPTFVLSVADATLEESVGAVAVTMELANPRADSVYRRCGLRAAAGGSAALGDDYALAANEERLRSRGGWRAQTTLTVVDDADIEADETAIVEGWCAGSNALARPPHGELRATPLALTILAGDDAADDIGLSLSTSPAAITEGGGEAEVTVSGTLTGLSVAPEADVTAVLSVGGGAIDGLDYTLSGSRTLTVPAGDATLTAGAALRIAALPDDLEEGDEYVEFSVTQVTRGGAVETLAERAAVSLLIADAWRVPPAPAGLRVSPSASDPARSLSAAWEAPGASPSVRSHHVDYRLRGDPDWSRRTVPAGETATTLAGLKAGMEYEVRVSAENAAGEGRPTGIAAVFTEELPCAPGAPGVAPPADGGDTELAAAWDAAADCGATIDRYRVRYREDPTREQTAADWREQAVSGLATTLRGLAAGTWHVVQARAESDAAGMSRWSPDGFGRTRGAPERVERPAASGGERSVRVDWDAPRDGGYPISDYDVWYRKSGEAEWTTHAFECGGAGPCPTATTISGLEADAAHEVVVRAENSAGAGEWSPVASAKTLRRLAAATIDGASATREIGSALDAAEEPAGWITCEVGSGDGYIVGRPRSKTVAVADAACAPADGDWETGAWGACSETACDVPGEQTREVWCAGTCGDPCDPDTKPATEQSCEGDDPRDGDWSECRPTSGTCGPGTRSCTNPRPGCGGAPCVGDTACTVEDCTEPPQCARLTAETGPPNSSNACTVGDYVEDPPDTAAVHDVCRKATHQCDSGEREILSDIPPDHARCGAPANTCASGSPRDLDDTPTHKRWQCLGVDGASRWNCNGADGAWNWSCTEGDATDDSCTAPTGVEGSSRPCSETLPSRNPECRCEINHWETGPWSACSETACDVPGEQTREVWCAGNLRRPVRSGYQACDGTVLRGRRPARRGLERMPADQRHMRPRHPKLHESAAGMRRRSLRGRDDLHRSMRPHVPPESSHNGGAQHRERVQGRHLRRAAPGHRSGPRRLRRDGE